MGIFDHNHGNAPTASKTDVQFNISVANGDDAAVIISTDLDGPFTGVRDPAFSGRFTIHVTKGGGTGASLSIKKDGFEPIWHRLTLADGIQPAIPFFGSYELKGETLIPLAPPFPAPPSRDEKITAKLHFGGLFFNHSVFGRMPLFDACFAWLSQVDRAEVYRVKKEAGDRHILIEVPSGVPLYDESGQPYSADRFGPLSYSPAFLDQVAEAIQNGFIPVLFMNEDHDTSLAAVQTVMHDMKAYKTDLVPYCIFSPGWDGIFYGWEPSHTVIPAWASAARAIDPNVTLFLEHDPGHIPLGEGGGDYKAGGDMMGFDIIAGEYPVAQDDTVWQVCARMACGPEGYHRPPDQPAGDDTNPPQYLPSSNERGPFAYWVFETGIYEFVRGRITPEAMDAKRDYYRKLGCQNVC